MTENDFYATIQGALDTARVLLGWSVQECLSHAANAMEEWAEEEGEEREEE